MRMGTALLFSIVLAICSAADERAPLKVITTLPPFGQVAQEVLGDAATVSVLLSQPQDPHGFELTSSAYISLSSADILFGNGAGIEFWLPSDMRKGAILLSDHLSPDEAVDPHLWLNPYFMIRGEEALEGVFCEKAPSHCAKVKERGLRFRSTVKKLAEEIQDEFRSFQMRAFVTYHPAWGNFARAFHLQQLGGFRDCDTHMLTAKSLQTLILAVNERKIRSIITEPWGGNLPPSAQDLNLVPRSLDSLGSKFANYPEFLMEIRRVFGESLRESN
jgi:ABC-type Zn uptake system ZnuABC Zn-binding protein ZnuA